jgi:predicted Fe-S protein YdhL (DUF1289 family)
MSNATTPMAVRAPCVKVCQMNGDTHLCDGCCRTQDERDWWVAYTPEQQREVLRRCEQRRDAIAAGSRQFEADMGPVESPRKRRPPANSG